MKPRLLLIVVGVAGGLLGCGDDDPAAVSGVAPLTIAFEGAVGADALTLGSRTYAANSTAEGFRPTRVSFYASDLVLLGGSSDGVAAEVPLDDVAYVELGPGGRGELNFAAVPTGTYTGLSFTLGLTADQDATSPADYGRGHPLGRESEYWVDWGSYIFLKLEGRSDTLADDRERFDAAYTYHVGRSAELARRVELTLPLSVDDDGATGTLALNLGALLGLGTAAELPLVGVADHRNGAARQIMDNAAAAFTVAD